MTTGPTTPRPPAGPLGGPEHTQATAHVPPSDLPGERVASAKGRIPAGVPWLIGGLVIGVILGGGGTALALTADLSGDVLGGAVAECGLENDANAVLSDDGSTLALDHRGEKDLLGLEISDVDCVLSELGVPDNVTHEMDKTRALDGRQKAEWTGSRPPGPTTPTAEWTWS